MNNLVLVYFALPDRYMVERYWPEYRGDIDTFYGKLKYERFVPEGNIFIPTLPERKNKKVAIRLIYIPLWIEQSDLDRLKNTTISLLPETNGTLKFAVDICIGMVSRGEFGTIEWVRSIYINGNVEDYTFSYTSNPFENTYSIEAKNLLGKKYDKDIEFLLEIALIIMSNNTALLFMHPAYISERDHFDSIYHTKDMNLPIYPERISQPKYDEYLVSVVQKNFKPKKGFVLITQSEKEQFDGIILDSTIDIPGYYVIKKRDFIVEFGINTHGSYLSIYQITRIDNESKKAYYTLRFSYVDGIWDTPTPPEGAVELLEYFKSNMDKIIERKIVFEPRY